VSIVAARRLNVCDCESVTASLVVVALLSLVTLWVWVRTTVRFLANRIATQYDRLWHNFVLCLSVCLWRCEFWLSGLVLVFGAKSCTIVFLSLSGMFLFVGSDPLLWDVSFSHETRRKTRKLSYIAISQRWPRDRAYAMHPIGYYECRENLRECLYSLTMPTATFTEIFNGLFFRLMLRIGTQDLKFVALPVPEISWGTQKIWTFSGYAHAPFYQTFNRLLFG